jgi:MFS family permease
VRSTLRAVPAKVPDPFLNHAHEIRFAGRSFRMSTTRPLAPPPTAPAPPRTSIHDQVLFWGCFIALVTTAFGFIARMFLLNTWQTEFGLTKAETGRLGGIGLWPFAFSIIGFSLFIDKIGYKISMIFAFICHICWAIMGYYAYQLAHAPSPDKPGAFQLLYWGSLVMALGNGTVEAFINPVVATMFSRNKTKWLNILHAGWPGGLVIAGVLTILLSDLNWGIKIGMMVIPTVLYFLILLPLRFPVQERVASGVSYRDMLSEFGILGAIVVGFLVTVQLMDFYSDAGTRQLSVPEYAVFIGIGVAIVVGFGMYTKSLGRPLMFFLILIMMPLAVTELGTDGWIRAMMESIASEQGYDAGWILVYTSAIMMVLRFFAGPIVHRISPLGLLACGATLALVGLYTLSFAVGSAIFLAATVYAFGKTFFWPTMLGVVSEQMPKGGALTLNAISGIGMLAVGTLGTAYIGALQDGKQIHAVAHSEVAKAVPGLIENGKLTVVEEKRIYEIIPYETISDKKLDAKLEQLPAEKREQVAQEIKDVRGRSTQGALANMVVFPAFMLACYLILILYFRAKGGYEAQVLTGHAAKDDEFTGGIEGAVEA